MPALSLALANSIHLRILVQNEYKRIQLLKILEIKTKTKKVIRRHTSNK